MDKVFFPYYLSKHVYCDLVLGPIETFGRSNSLRASVIEVGY